MLTQAWYEPSTDYYVIEFNDAAFVLPEWVTGREPVWSMFTHGVCATQVAGRLLFHRLAIVGGQLGEINETNLAQRLEKAARVLQLMGQNVEAHNPGSFQSCQCLQASEILSQEQAGIIATLLASYAQWRNSAQGAA
jgi:hypothetical protein